MIVPGCETLRKTTLDCLRLFKGNGGDIVLMGDAPQLVDAVPSDEGQFLYVACRRISFSKSALVKALHVYRDVELRSANGTTADRLLYQLREDGEKQYSFFHFPSSYTR